MYTAKHINVIRVTLWGDNYGNGVDKILELQLTQRVSLVTYRDDWNPKWSSHAKYVKNEDESGRSDERMK